MKCTTCGLNIGGTFGCFGHIEVEIDLKKKTGFVSFDKFPWEEAKFYATISKYGTSGRLLQAVEGDTFPFSFEIKSLVKNLGSLTSDNFCLSLEYFQCGVSKEGKLWTWVDSKNLHL